MLRGLLTGPASLRNAVLNKVKQTCAAGLFGAFTRLVSTLTFQEGHLI